MANKGELDTQEGVGLAVRRLLEDPKLAKPRILRFFREYFGYENAADVFKETKDMPGHDPRALIEDTDRLIIYILEQDKQVLRELLTTNKAFVMYKGAAESKQKRAEALANFEEDKKKNPEKFKDKKPNLPGRAVYESYNLEDFPDEQPVELPKEQRAGILTQPSWLIAWSTADDNHAHSPRQVGPRATARRSCAGYSNHRRCSASRLAASDAPRTDAGDARAILLPVPSVHEQRRPAVRNV
jgi:hypothetical protein